MMAAKGLLEGVVEFTPDELLELATELEGHPDNVAPALFGGLTIAWVTPEGPRHKKLIVHRGVSPLVLVPEHEMSTALARSLQPESVPHSDAVFNVSRSALLIAALIQSPELLLQATEDKLHQHYRAQAMPETDRLIRVLRAAGHPAVVSGAGPVDPRARAATRASGPMRCASSRSRRTPRGRPCRSPSTSRARRSSTPSADAPRSRRRGIRSPPGASRVGDVLRSGVRIVPHPAGDAQFASPGRIVQFPAIYCFRSRACLRHRAPTSLVPAISSPGSAILATRGKEHTQ